MLGCSSVFLFNFFLHVFCNSTNISLVYCIFSVLHPWCCILYMHFWYAMHSHLWWCLVGAITIVQCIFGASFLGIGCNLFFVLRLWCYALSAISRRLATAVAHLLYVQFKKYIFIYSNICMFVCANVKIIPFLS